MVCTHGLIAPSLRIVKISSVKSYFLVKTPKQVVHVMEEEEYTFT